MVFYTAIKEKGRRWILAAAFPFDKWLTREKKKTVLSEKQGRNRFEFTGTPATDIYIISYWRGSNNIFGYNKPAAGGTTAGQVASQTD